MAELARELYFALEAGQDLRARETRADQLDRGRPPQESVARPIHRAHSPLADLVFERVLPESLGPVDLLLQAVEAHRGERDRGGDEQESHAQHPEGPADDAERPVRFVPVDLGDDADAPLGQPPPRPHHEDSAIVAVAVRIDAGASGHDLGRGQGEGPALRGRLGGASRDEGGTGVADLEHGRRAAPRLGRQETELLHLFREARFRDHAAVGVQRVGLTRLAQARNIQDRAHPLREDPPGEDRDGLAARVAHRHHQEGHRDGREPLLQGRSQEDGSPAEGLSPPPPPPWTRRGRRPCRRRSGPRSGPRDRSRSSPRSPVATPRG